MRTIWWRVVKPHSLQHALYDIVADVLELFPIAAFILVSSIPSEALAFTEYIEMSQKPIVFVRDPSLPDTAVVGIEAFSRVRTAADVLAAPSSRIPQATSKLAPGVAIRVMASAYSSTPDQTDGDPFTTASGTQVHPGTLATNFLPFGTKVRIGDTIYTVEDRMNSRYNGKYIVDIWFPTRQEARNFGVQVVPLEIYSLP